MRHLAILVSLALCAGAPAQAQIMLLPDERIQPRPKPPAKKRMPPVQAVARAEPALVNDSFPRRLRQDELKALFFNGTPIAARGLVRDISTVTFQADGKMARTSPDTPAVQTGQWRFSGDAYCSKWEGKPELCFTVVKDGDIYKVVYGTRAVSFWTAPEAQPNVATNKSAPEQKDQPFAASAPATTLSKVPNGQ